MATGEVRMGRKKACENDSGKAQISARFRMSARTGMQHATGDTRLPPLQLQLAAAV